MKITSGLGSIDDYPRYVRAGADELFCGYVPFSWSEKYGTVLPLNRIVQRTGNSGQYGAEIPEASAPDVQFIVLSAGAV